MPTGMVSSDRNASDGAAAPRVSIIIAVSRGGECLAACLQSLHEHLPSRPSSEIVLVVNGTSGQLGDSTPRWCDRVTVLQTETRLSVASACNLASTRSVGEFLILLDECAIIEPGWLEWLIHTVEANPDAGAAASAILFPDGRLQEAGTIVWWDGSTTGVGRGTQGDALTWRFVRPVDSASGRALLVRRAIWDRVGGFDDAFSAGFSHDVDLCLRIRRLGKHVLLEPRSRVRVEAPATSTDFDAFIHRRCRLELLRRWQRELLTHEPASSGAVGRAIHRARGCPRRLLVVDDFVPDPAAGAGFGRMFDAIIELTQSGWAVSHFPTRGASAPDDTLIDCGLSIVQGDVLAHLQHPDTWYEAVLVSRPHNFEFVWPALRTHQPWARLVYDAEALWWRRIARQAELSVEPDIAARLRAEAAGMQEIEIRNVRASDFTVTVSDEERAILLNEGLSASCVRTLPPFGLGVRITERPFMERGAVGFVAGWMAGAASPNGDGLLWFIREVLPLIRRTIPGVRIRVTGKNPPSELLALADPNVCFEGHVADLGAFYDQIRVAIVPNRFGSGVKLKTVQAMQYGVPTVSTSIGAEGLVLTSSKGLRISDDRVAFATDVVQLLTDEREWLQSRAVLIAQVSAWKSARAAGRTWPELLDELCTRRNDETRPFPVHQ